MRWLSDRTKYKRVILQFFSLLTFMWLWERRPILEWWNKDTCRNCTLEEVLCSHASLSVYTCSSHTQQQSSFDALQKDMVPSLFVWRSAFANPCDSQVTLGLFGHEEVVISNPLSPGVIQGIIYSKCSVHGGEREAVLQQELVIHIGWIISNNPELFSGMLKIRVG